MENKDEVRAKTSETIKAALTPHELVQHHMEHPDELITEEDMNNLILSDETETEKFGTTTGDEVQLSRKEKADADELADEISKDNTGMSYEAGI